MRSYDEIRSDITDALRMTDVVALNVLAQEMAALNTPRSAAAALHARGFALECTGDFIEAMELYREALSKYTEAEDLEGIARATTNIGYVCYLVGDYPQAIEQHRHALALFEDKVDIAGMAASTGNLGIAYYASACYPQALECFQHAYSLYEQAGRPQGTAVILINIGNVLSSMGDHELAMESYRKANAICTEVGDPASAATAILSIGEVMQDTGKHEDALEQYDLALSTFERLGNKAGIAMVYGNIIRALISMDRDDEADRMLAQQASMQMDSPNVFTRHLENRALLAERRGELDTAHDDLLHSLEIASEIGIREDIAYCHIRLRDLAQKRNDFAGYINHNNEYNRIADEIRGKETIQRLAVMEAERRMEDERREHEKERAVLYSTLPKHVADRVVRGEKVAGDHFDLASVIFLDIVGFTRISDRIPPGHVVHLLGLIFSALDTVCKKHDVTKIKTIGDSYMAVTFPSSEQRVASSEQRAAECAIDMLAVLNALEITMPPDLGDTSWTKDVGDIRVRIGVHCGPVTAGVIGTERLQYDVWGDTVNVASRMESTGEPGRIHVSDAFAQHLTVDALTLVPRGVVDVKGKGAMSTYWLERA